MSKPMKPKYKTGDIVVNIYHELYFFIYGSNDTEYYYYVLKAVANLYYKENTKNSSSISYVDVCFNKI